MRTGAGGPPGELKERRVGRARPRLYFPLSFLLPFPLSPLPLSFVRRVGDAGERVTPVWPSVVGGGIWSCRGGRSKSAAVREGDGKPLPWPFEPHAARYKIKDIHIQPCLTPSPVPAPDGLDTLGPIPKQPARTMSLWKGTCRGTHPPRLSHPPRSSEWPFCTHRPKSSLR